MRYKGDNMRTYLFSLAINHRLFFYGSLSPKFLSSKEHGVRRSLYGQRRRALTELGVPTNSMCLFPRCRQWAARCFAWRVLVRSMSFKCQRDCYLQHFKSAVLSCEPARLGEKEGYEVVLEDTILFPEGGGQVR